MFDGYVYGVLYGRTINYARVKPYYYSASYLEGVENVVHENAEPEIVGPRCRV